LISGLAESARVKLTPNCALKEKSVIGFEAKDRLPQRSGWRQTIQTDCIMNYKIPIILINSFGMKGQ
jgi:hypothetical protein